jgi:NADH:ubiquinone oxidoreductase subunit 6 (subunit J)
VQDVAVLVLAALTVSLAALAMVLEQSVRAAACLIGAAVFAAGLAFLGGVGDLSVALITTTAAGTGLLLMMLSLLLSLTPDETGGRRFRFWPALHLLVLLWVISVAAKLAGPLGTDAMKPLAAGAATRVLFEPLGLGLAFAGLALLASLLTLLVVARRSA